MESLIIEMYEIGVKVNEIASNFNITRGCVYYYLRKNEVSPNRRQKFTDEYIDCVIEDYRIGMSLEELKEKYHKSVDMLLYRNIKGERREYLTYNERKRLEELMGVGRTSELARIFNVTDATISYHRKVLKNKSTS